MTDKAFLEHFFLRNNKKVRQGSVLCFDSLKVYQKTGDGSMS